MSRSGYSDDFDDGSGRLELYRRAVHNATHGRRGQAFLVKLRDALDAMPVKRLIADVVRDEQGEVCALGAVDPRAPQDDDDWAQADKLAAHFGIAHALAAEIVYMNDDGVWRVETPEERWTRMRAWVEAQLVAPLGRGPR